MNDSSINQNKVSSLPNSQSLATQFLQLLPKSEIVSLDAPNITLIRSDGVTRERIPVIYDPCIYFVIQGSKSALLAGEDFIYDAMNYLVLSVPLPLECMILEATEDKPYLAIKINIDTQLLTELVQETNGKPDKEVKAHPGIFVSQVGEEINSSLSRLLGYIGNKEQANVLGKLAIKELLFHVLQGPQGAQLRSFAYRDRQNFQIARAIGYIQENFSKNIEVAELAAKANMSQSSFHSYFKSITSSSPIQYIKAIRLHAARRNMIHDRYSASDAAFNVGYSSPSQFSREYRRFFGAPPSVDVKQELVQ
ncbi:MAG: AraC family transcriptional regulator [Kangiellaceae bacterium]|nr:AraC family transcriptional regulator [Kangiellaceae bacterium]